MFTRIGVWVMGVLLMVTAAGCVTTGRQAQEHKSGATPTSVTAHDVASHLASRGIEAQVKSAEMGGQTVTGIADSSLVVAGQKEIWVQVFPSIPDASKAFEGRMHPRWPRPTTFFLWKNAFIVVTNSDASNGVKVVEALTTVADRIDVFR